ncbi:MAG: CPBP family intramembrane metalloprotease [Clostridia bacterium]|nr:CPBP family intramembrane metalloprotease [Clostridia bacterium]
MSRKLSVPLTLALLGAVILLFLINPTYSANETAQRLWESLLYRLLGSGVLILLLLDFGFLVFGTPKVKSLCILLPCFAVAINNLPVLSLIDGDAYLTQPSLIWLFALDCLAVSLFEELAFRGLLLPVLLKSTKGRSASVFWSVVCSSALFGAFHLLNLLEGASLGATALQVGYSFLIGGMCAVAFLKTKNLLFCIPIHAVYNLCGGLLPTLGAGSWWDMPTVILTAVLGVVVFVLMLWVLLRMRWEEIRFLYRDDEKNT